jgi:hypothetical protein
MVAGMKNAMTDLVAVSMALAAIIAIVASPWINIVRR